MEGMKHRLRAEVEKKKDMMHQLKEEAANMVENKRQMMNNLKEEAMDMVDNKKQTMHDLKEKDAAENKRQMMCDLKESAEDMLENKMQTIHDLKEDAEDMVEKKKEAIKQRVRSEVENKKQAMHNVKEDVHDAVQVVGGALFGRRPRVGSIRSDNTASGDVSIDLDASNIAGSVLEAERGQSEKGKEKYHLSEGTSLEWPHLDLKVKDVDILKMLSTVKGEDLAAKLKDVDINQVLRAVPNGKDGESLKDNLLLKLPITTKPKPLEQGDMPSTGLNKKETERTGTDEVEECDEEVIELEFERAAERIHTHREYKMFCPNCSNEITKVVLRRTIRKPRKSSEKTWCQDLFGCLSCLGIIWRQDDLIIPIPDEVPPGTTRPVIPPESQSSRPVEILKSVVYGGLMESLASLSVVSSAAASEATTLNIVALGLANLVGGLVVLAHNLRDLRYGESNETNEQRYKEELGRKEHFLLHAVVAVISYLVFGLIPPVIYGFTFRESDDRDFKLLALAAASLLCIITLAITKAYVRGEHKFIAYFKTAAYYVTSAVMVSGIAFAVGDLVNQLIKRLGWFNSAAVGPQSFPGTKSLDPSWASY